MRWWWAFPLALAAQRQAGMPVPQPIPFSHQAHVTLGSKCADCHAIKPPGFAAGLPREDTCMACHVAIKTESPAVQKLAEFHKAKKPIRWAPVYRLPDYVWFSHQAHHRKAGLSCETCHGPVGERQALWQEKPISMVACMACHDEHKASNECDLCHDPR